MNESDKDEANSVETLEVLQLQRLDALDVLLCVATDASSQVDSAASLDVSDVQIRVSRQVRVNIEHAHLGVDVSHVQVLVSLQLWGNQDGVWSIVHRVVGALNAQLLDVVVSLTNTVSRHGDWFSHVL